MMTVTTSGDVHSQSADERIVVRPGGARARVERVDEGPGQLGVELRARSGNDLLACVVGRARLAIWPLLGDRVIRVDDRNEPGAYGNLVAPKTVGVAATIPPLMVRSDDGRHQLAELQGFDDGRPDAGVLAHV